MTHVNELFDLTGKVAVVTGGGHGLGYFAAEGLAEAGADLVICGRDRAKLDQAASAIVESTGRTCVAFGCDVTSESDVVALREQVVEQFGRCDILINNAGIGGMGPTHEFSVQQWENVMEVNLKGMFLVSREIGKIMLAQKSGSIINFSSENGQVGFSFGMTAYATSKIGAVGMSRSLAAEWGPHGVRVNALLPGNMEEGMMADLKNSDS